MNFAIRWASEREARHVEIVKLLTAAANKNHEP